MKIGQEIGILAFPSETTFVHRYNWQTAENYSLITIFVVTIAHVLVLKYAGKDLSLSKNQLN